MKRWIQSILSLLLVLATLFSFASCGSKKGPEYHDCSNGEYDFTLTSEDHGNCQKVGYKVFTCACGYSYRVYNTEKGDHVYGDDKIVIIEATYSSEGLKAYRCKIQGCGAHDPESEEVIPKKTTDFPGISGGDK